MVHLPNAIRRLQSLGGSHSNQDGLPEINDVPNNIAETVKLSLDVDPLELIPETVTVTHQQASFKYNPGASSPSVLLYSNTFSEEGTHTVVCMGDRRPAARAPNTSTQPAGQEPGLVRCGSRKRSEDGGSILGIGANFLKKHVGSLCPLSVTVAPDTAESPKSVTTPGQQEPFLRCCSSNGASIDQGNTQTSEAAALAEELRVTKAELAATKKQLEAMKEQLMRSMASAADTEPSEDLQEELAVMRAECAASNELLSAAEAQMQQLTSQLYAAHITIVQLQDALTNAGIPAPRTPPCGSPASSPAASPPGTASTATAGRDGHAGLVRPPCSTATATQSPITEVKSCSTAAGAKARFRRAVSCRVASPTSELDCGELVAADVTPNQYEPPLTSDKQQEGQRNRAISISQSTLLPANAATSKLAAMNASGQGPISNSEIELGLPPILTPSASVESPITLQPSI